MNLIKLDAIDSTNEFLKKMSHHQKVDDFTVIWASNQTHGRGQMGAMWESEPSKNLTFSVLINNLASTGNNLFVVNIMCCLSILSVLQELQIPNLTLKWPNDIMSDSKKIGGVLIENIFKPNSETVTIIGIGLNVNQANFDLHPKASSLANISGKLFDLDLILKLIVAKLKHYVALKEDIEIDNLWDYYQNSLFKKDKVVAFEDQKQNLFLGIIKGVDKSGKLKISDDIGNVQLYDLKQVKMLY